MKHLILLFPVLWAGCAGHSLRDSGTREADLQFERLAEEYTAGYLAWRPQMATSLGLHEHDGRITDYSQASLDAELARLKSCQRRLAELEVRRLGRRAAYDYGILQMTIGRELFAFEDLRAYWQNPMTYAGALDLNLYLKRDFAPLEARTRYIVAMLDQVPGLMAAARANLGESLPRPHVEMALLQSEGTLGFLRQDLPQALGSVTNGRLMAQFKAANDRAIDEITAFATWLKDVKLPKADDRYALGRERYARMLQCEMVTLSPEKLLELGMAELKRQATAFTQAAREVDPAKSPVAVFQAIQQDHPTAENLIPDTVRNLEAIRQFVVDRRIVTLPSPVRAAVKEMPQYLRATAFASMDTPGPFEARATEAYYYVTPPEASWPAKQQEQWLTAFNYYTTDIVSIHEAYPGHYAQFLCLNASPANRLEKIFMSYSFVEGWAHYTEEMMIDEGFGAGPSRPPAPAERVQAAKYRLAQVDEALLRVCRLCVSIRMHCQGMTVDDATRFFQDNCHYEEKPARQEALRGTYDPEYLYYTLGKLEILKLREDYRRQEGERFTLETFHNHLLRHGAPPIRLLRQVLLEDSASWDAVL